MGRITLQRKPKDGGETVLYKVNEDEQLADWWKEFGNPDLRKVFEGMSIELFRRSSCLEGFSSFLNRQNFRGKRCVEIGTCNGLTSIVLSRLFEEVVTLDILPSESKRAAAEFCGIKNIQFLDIENNDDKAQIIKNLDFDAAYCDGNHEHDTQIDFDLVKHTKKVLFHEYWPLQPHVWNLVNSLRASGSVVSHGTFAIWRG